MSIVGLEQLLAGFGFAPSIGVATAISIVFALVCALALFGALNIARLRFAPSTTLHELITVVRKPLAVLVFLTLVIDYVGLLLTTKFAFDLSAATLNDLIFIAVVLWIVLSYLRSIEGRLDKRARAQGAVKLPLLDEKIDRNSLQVFFKVLRGILAIAIVLMLLDAFDISITGLLAFGGVGGIIVGFAARDLIADIFSGMRIFWARPFVVGDWIKSASNNIEGVVESIGWQVTQIRTFDKRPLYVPNSLLADSVIENPQRMTNRRIFEYFGVRYSDIKKIPAILKDVRKLLVEHPQIDDDQIMLVNLDRYGPYSVDFLIYAMVKTTNWAAYHGVKEEILLGVADAVFANDADFAFPTSTVHLDSPLPERPAKPA